MRAGVLSPTLATVDAWRSPIASLGWEGWLRLRPRGLCDHARSRAPRQAPGGGVRRPIRRLGRLFARVGAEGPTRGARCRQFTACGSNPRPAGLIERGQHGSSACIRRLALRRLRIASLWDTQAAFGPSRAPRAARIRLGVSVVVFAFAFGGQFYGFGRDDRRPADELPCPVGIHSSPKGMWLFRRASIASSAESSGASMS
jgi:hypothetical protein